MGILQDCSSRTEVVALEPLASCFGGIFLLQYASGMILAKRSIFVSIDEDLVAELEAVDQSLSAQVNAILRENLKHRRRQRRLAEYLDQLDAEEGPINEALVDKYARLLT